MKRLALLILPLALAGCPEDTASPAFIDEVANAEGELGYADDPTVADEWPSEVMDPTVVETPTDTGDPGLLSSCQANLVWSQQPGTYDFLYGDSELSLSPNEQMALLQSGLSRQFLLVRDGTYLGRANSDAGSVPSMNWGTDTRIVDGAIEVISHPDGTVSNVLTPPPPSDPAMEWLSQLTAAVSPQGNKVAALACWDVVGPGPSEVAVTIFNAESGQISSTATLDDDCQQLSSWLERPRMLFANGDLLLVHLPGSNRIHLVDDKGSTPASVDVVGGLQPGTPVTGEAPAYVPFLSPVADMALSPHKERLAVVLHDGRIRFYSLPKLDQSGPTIDAGFAGINLMTYGPSTAAPVVWSASGKMIAHMAPDGRVAVSRTNNGELVQLFDNPEAVSAGAAQDFVNPPVAMHFLHKDATLLVVHEMGWQLWSCFDPAWPDLVSGPVKLQGPESVKQSQEATFLFDYSDIPGPVVHSLWQGDGQSPIASLSRSVSAYLYGSESATVTGSLHSGTMKGLSTPLTVAIEVVEW